MSNAGFCSQAERRSPAAEGQAPQGDGREAAFLGEAARREEAPEPSPAGGQDTGTGLSARTNAAAAGPHRSEPGLMAQLALMPSSSAGNLGSCSPGRGSLAGSLLPTATASGSGPAAGEHREPSEGGQDLG